VGDRHVGRLDRLAGEQRAHGLDRDREDDGEHTPRVGEPPVDAEERGLHVERVLLRLEEEDVGAALDEPDGLLRERRGDLVEGDAPGNRDGLGARTHRAGDKARAIGRLELRARLAGEASGGGVDLAHLVREPVFGERDARAAEGVGLDDVGAGGEVALVHVAHDVGPGEDEVLVAALVRLAGLRRPRRFFADLLERIRDDNILTVAAALSYYFFFAFFPFLLFLLALVSLLPVHGLEDWLLAQGGQVIPGEAYGMLERTVRGLLRQPRSGLVSVGAALALWSASAGFAGVMEGLNRAYRVRESRPWWRVRLEAVGLTVGLSLFMIVAFVLAVFGGQLATLVGQTLGPAGVVAALVARWVVALGLDRKSVV